MKDLKSQFSIMQVIVTPIVLILVVCFLSSIITFTSLEMTKDGTPLYKTPIWTVLLFIVLLFYTLRYYLITFKHYTFLDKGFEVKTVFGKEFYSWKTIEQISIVITPVEKILGLYQNEDALVFELKDYEILKMFSKYYKNMPEIRRYITSRKDLNSYNSYDNDIKSTFQFFKKNTFKGKFILSINAFIALLLTVLSVFMLWHSWSSMTQIGLLVLIGIPISTFLIFGFQSYYFQLDKKYLIIRNHIFLHIKHQINLEKVRVIYFEQKFKRESSIRIINDDFSMVSFQSNSLKDKQWKSLILNLKKQNINIVDELFHEYNE